MKEIVVREEWKDDQLTMWVDARTLWEALGVDTRFNDWFDRRVKAYGFQQDSDFYSVLSKGPEKNYECTIDMAKELAMVEKTDEGREARQYFLRMEKRALGLDLVGNTAKETLANIDRTLRAAMQSNNLLLSHEERLDGHDRDIAKIKDRPVIQPLYKTQDLSILRIKFRVAIQDAVRAETEAMDSSQREGFFRVLNGGLKKAVGGMERDKWKVEHYIIAVEWLLEERGINISHILKNRRLDEVMPFM